MNFFASGPGVSSKRKAEFSKGKGEKIWRAIYAFFGFSVLCSLPFILSYFDGPKFLTLDPKNKVQMQNVFFEGEPWLIFCHQNLSTPLHSMSILSSTADIVSMSATPREFRFATMNCLEPLASGRHVIDRFNLAPSANTPKQIISAASNMAFSVANGDMPKALPSSYMQKNDPRALIQYLRTELATKYYLIENTQQLEKMCLVRRSGCLVILNKGRNLDTNNGMLFGKVVSANRSVRYAIIDSDVHELDGDNIPDLKASRATSDGLYHPMLLMFVTAPAKTEDDVTLGVGSSSAKLRLLSTPFRQSDYTLETISDFVKVTVAAASQPEQTALVTHKSAPSLEKSGRTKEAKEKSDYQKRKAAKGEKKRKAEEEEQRKKKEQELKMQENKRRSEIEKEMEEGIVKSVEGDGTVQGGKPIEDEEEEGVILEDE